VTRWLYSSQVCNQGHEFATSSDGKERMKYIYARGIHGKDFIKPSSQHLLSKQVTFTSDFFISEQEPIKIPRLNLITFLLCTIQAFHNGIPDPSQDLPCRHLPGHQRHITPALHQRQEHRHIRRRLRYWPRNRPLIRKVWRL
jgi:hypothetical protein